MDRPVLPYQVRRRIQLFSKQKSKKWTEMNHSEMKNKQALALHESKVALQ